MTNTGWRQIWTKMKTKEIKKIYEQKCCIYRHITLDDDITFYVGKDEIYGLRAHNFCKRNEIHESIVKRHGIRVEILEFCEDHKHACEREIYWIATLHTFINAPHVKHAANKTIGGDGTPGLNPSLETRQKLSKACKGKKQSPEHIEKRIAPLRGTHNVSAMGKQSHERIKNRADKLRGKPFTKSHCENIRKGKALARKNGKRMQFSLKRSKANTGDNNPAHKAMIKRRFAYYRMCIESPFIGIIHTSFNNESNE